MKQQTKDKVLEQIQKQRRSQSRQKDHTITSLEFTNIVIEDFTNSIDEYLKNFNNLEHLQFRKCKIRSLNNLSDYNKIISLDLEENQLDESSLKQIVQHFPSLRFLNLRKNQIKDEFSHFKTLSQLTHLQLDKNPLTDTSEIWNWVPNLKALDGLDQNGKIVRDSDEEDDEDEEDFDDDESFSMDDEDDEDFDSEDDVSSSSNRKKKKKVKK